MLAPQKKRFDSLLFTLCLLNPPLLPHQFLPSSPRSSHMVSAYSGPAGGDQERPSPNRSHTRRSPWPPQPLHSLKIIPAAAVRSAAKSTSTPSCATGSSTCWTTGGQNGDGACSGACARSSGCAPGCSKGSTRTLRFAEM